MPGITALLHTYDDELRIGRALETLRPCDEVIVVDHGSHDRTLRIAREYGVVFRKASGHASETPRFAKFEWVLCMRPTESVSEALEASLYEWKLRDENDLAGVQGVMLTIREEDAGRWTETAPELRLVRRDWTDWATGLPAGAAGPMALEGDVLRFRSP